jgi:hypothetical protein
MIRKIKNYNSQEMCHSLNINHIMNWMIKQQVLQNEHSLLFLNVFVFPQEKNQVHDGQMEEEHVDETSAIREEVFRRRN